MSCKINDGVATLHCQTLLSSRVKNPSQSSTLTRACRHSLYSAACGAAKKYYPVTVIQTDTRNRRVYFRGDSGSAAVFAGGVIGNAQIVTVTGDGTAVSPWIAVVTDLINNPVQAGYQQILSGCDRTTTSCATFNQEGAPFSNIVNYGGFISIPAPKPEN